MKKFRVVLLFLFLSLPTFATTENFLEIQTNAENLFSSAKELYYSDKTEAIIKLKESKNLYKKLKENFNNYPVNFNLGNISFLLEEYPEAIYYYRVAEKFHSSREVKKSIKLTREFLHETLEETSYQKIYKSIFFYHYYIPLLLKKIVSLIFFILTLSFFVLNLFFSKKFFNVISFIFALLFVFNIIFVISGQIALTTKKDGVILNISKGKTGDGDFYEDAFDQNIPLGAEFTILDRREGWIKIKLLSGQICWIKQDVGQEI